MVTSLELSTGDLCLLSCLHTPITHSLPHPTQVSLGPTVCQVSERKHWTGPVLLGIPNTSLSGTAGALLTEGRGVVGFHLGILKSWNLHEG